MLREEDVWPALMVAPSTSTATLLTLAEDAPQAHPYPLVEARERGLVAVLEVLEPSDGSSVDALDDVGQAVAVGSSGLAANRVLELHQAALAGPFHASLEVIPEEVESSRLGGVHETRLVRMQRQARRRSPFLYRG